jgi:hypothetical protein
LDKCVDDSVRQYGKRDRAINIRQSLRVVIRRNR